MAMHSGAHLPDPILIPWDCHVPKIQGVAELVQRYLDQIRDEHARVTDGALATYIPELAGVDPTGFGLSLSLSDGYLYESGDATVEFTIQSVSKPFTYALALDQIGQDAVDARIGVEPSGEAFNEISVDVATKTPKNPMINAGAIAAVSLVPGATPDERFARIREFYSAFAGRPLDIDTDVYASEKETGSRNRAIAYMLQSFGVLDGDPDEVLDVYFRQCSFKVTSSDLARMAATLARGGVNPMTGRRVTDTLVIQRTLAVMVTCGMYDAAGDWVSAVGMPAKSGVALHLFSEQGYDDTTVAEIADRAGLTKSTFFRHFPDKREVLAAGQETLSRLLAEGISAAPADASPLAAVAAGLERATGAMTPFNRELGPRLRAVIATSTELQERDALKQVGLAAAMATALRARGVTDLVAVLAAELGVLAFKEAYAAWVAADNQQGLAELARTALDQLHNTVGELS
jgi:glutaminase A